MKVWASPHPTNNRSGKPEIHMQLEEDDAFELRDDLISAFPNPGSVADKLLDELERVLATR